MDLSLVQPTFPSFTSLFSKSFCYHAIGWGTAGDWNVPLEDLNGMGGDRKVFELTTECKLNGGHSFEGNVPNWGDESPAPKV